MNVGQAERWVSAVGGGALALYGLTRGNLAGVGLALVGASLIHRGTTGHCYAYDAIGVNTAAEGENPNVSVRGGSGVKVEKSLTINREPAELFRYWRNLENLPRIMRHLESVTVLDAKRSHWKAKAPAGMSVEWDAVIHNEIQDELIAWKSAENASVPNAGSVHFRPAPGTRGTEVRVILEYEPPAGKLGVAVARLFGEEPELQVRDDLRRFKQLMEAGECPTTEGQPVGRCGWM